MSLFCWPRGLYNSLQTTCHWIQACTSLNVDIITLDLSKRMPFRLKPAAVQAALKRGIFFEVSRHYSYYDVALPCGCMSVADS